MSAESGARSPELTPEIKKDLVTKPGSLLHDERRAPRKQPDGSFEPKVRETKDEAWKAVHGKAEVDIANTSFADLPADWQGENRAATEVTMNIVHTVSDPAKLEAGTSYDQLVEAAQRASDERKIRDIRTNLGVDQARDRQDLQKKTPEELYNIFFADKLQAVIEAWGFGPKIEHCKAILAKATDKNRANYEKEAVKYLISQFKEIPFKKWAFFPEVIIKERAMNCSGSALFFSHIMNSGLNIKTEQANPWGHSANLVTYSDGSIQYVDPRNQVAFDLDLHEPIEETDGFRIYKVKKRGLEFSLLPVAKAEQGATLVYLENSREIQKDRNHDDEANATLNSYAHVLNSDFATRYMENNFLIRRENDSVWRMEKERIAKIRKLQRVPLLGRLF